MADSRGILSEIRVVEYADFVSGPFAHDVPALDTSLLLNYLNGNKLGITLDITSPTGYELLQKLLEGADVFIYGGPAPPGKGQYIDCSMAETTMDQIPEFFLDYTVNGRLSGPQGNNDGRGAAPHNNYRCQGADSWLAIAVNNQVEREAFCNVIGSPEWTQDSRFVDQFRRWKNRYALDKLVESWTREQDALEAMHTLQQAGVGAAVCQGTKVVLEDPHLNARAYYVELEQELVGRKPVMRLPWLLDPGPNGRYFPAPTLGQHNDIVFREILKLSDTQIEELRAAKVIIS